MHHSTVRLWARFNQTLEYAQACARLGRKPRTLGVFDGEELVATAVLVEEKDDYGTILYGPRGPVTNFAYPAQASEVLRAIGAHAKAICPEAICVRFDPAIPRESPAATAFAEAGYRSAGRYVQTETCWMVELQDTPDLQLQWLKANGMAGKVPRFIRRTAEAGVSVRSSDQREDLDRLLVMIEALDARKGGIGLNSREEFYAEWDALAPAGYQRIYWAEHKGQILAGAMIGIFGSEAEYLWTAMADTRDPDLYPSHFLNFRIMEEMRKLGCDRYNMHGVVPERFETNPRFGWSIFKRRFGGYQEVLLRTQDLALDEYAYDAMWDRDTEISKKFLLSAELREELRDELRAELAHGRK